MNNKVTTNINANANTNTIGNAGVSTTIPPSPMVPTGTVQAPIPSPVGAPVDTVIAPPTPPVIPNEPPVVAPPKKKKSVKTFLFIFLLLLIIGGMSYYIYTDYIKDKARECSPLVSGDSSLRRLDINTTIVQDLYQQVVTTIREDIAHNTFDEELKLYLAYRQIPQSKIYESNCNLFNDAAMLPFTCHESVDFTPSAFKEETLQLELKKLFGEKTAILNTNVQLGSSCFGGYQYIAERGEYVKGYCKEIATTTYNVEKQLIEASVQEDTITIKEKVRYYSGEGITSDKLQSGVYVHTFKLDNNYNYIYTNRTIEGS